MAGNRLSADWQKALVTRMDKVQIDSFAALQRSLTNEETAWLSLFEANAEKWSRFADSLAVPFPGIPIKDTIYVMTGFMGVDDAFTYGSQTVCLDVTAFLHNYGLA